MKFYQDSHIIGIYNKDCRQMIELPDESVQCVVTSPPYWGLRKYAGEQDLIWGDNHCEHQWETEIRQTQEMDYSFWKTGGIKDNTGATGKIITNFCSLCGAWKGAFGLEPTPEMYVQHTIEILREIRRVLRKDGVVFWNIGDSYAGSGGANENKERGGVIDNPNRKPQSTISGMEPVTWLEGGKPKKKGMTRVGAVKGLKPKDLCLIPFRIAIAAQEDNWWVRSVIIWSKPNPMPESVTDRPTESHEYILMLTKSARYYWDADAVRTPHKPASIERANYPINPFGEGNTNSGAKLIGSLKGGMERVMLDWNPAGANIKTVWEFPTKGYPEAHFAVFPEKLPETCIKAATPEVGRCSKCGKPWVRIVANKPMEIRRTDWGDKAGNRTASSGTMISPNESKTLGWQPTCKCNADKVPSLVLDPFAGAGTTLWVAKKLNRRAVGYEISEEYCKLALERNRQQVLGF